MGDIGILGGTFNPPHIGHLVCAQEARAALGLDRVLLIPVATPPHKELVDDPGAQLRIELCRRAASGDDGLEVCELEIRRGGRSYTVDTLRALRSERPEDELTLITGADMAVTLPRWREPEEILSMARLAVAERQELRREHIRDELCAALPAAQGRLEFFSMPRLDVSSSDVRARVAAGLPYRHLVPETVRQEIERHGLYLTGAAVR